MIFSVALFGHYKPRYYLMDRKTNLIVHQIVDDPGDFSRDPNYYVYEVQGWEKRAEPGDVIAIKPAGSLWTPLEYKQFLIIEIDGLESLQQEEALKEPKWDINSYRKYAPMTKEEWYAIVYAKALAVSDSINAIAKLEANQDAWYIGYVEGEKERCRYPMESLKKRRFNIKLDDLEVEHIDLELMLDPQIEYKPKVVFPKDGVNDKVTNVYLPIDAKLDPIKPLEDSELKI